MTSGQRSTDQQHPCDHASPSTCCSRLRRSMYWYFFSHRPFGHRLKLKRLPVNLSVLVSHCTVASMPLFLLLETRYRRPLRRGSVNQRAGVSERVEAIIQAFPDMGLMQRRKEPVRDTSKEDEGDGHGPGRALKRNERATTPTRLFASIVYAAPPRKAHAPTATGSERPDTFQ